MSSNDWEGRITAHKPSSFRRGPRYWGAALLWVTLLLGWACAPSEDDVDGPCGQLRDHLVDLRLKDAAAGSGNPRANSAAVTAAINLDAHRAAMKAALGQGFIASCQRALSKQQIQCALAAHDLPEAQACHRSPNSKSPSVANNAGPLGRSSSHGSSSIQ